MCTVPCVSRAGVVWAEGAQAVASLLVRVAGFRRWAEPDTCVKDADARCRRPRRNHWLLRAAQAAVGPLLVSLEAFWRDIAVTYV